jgi:NAD(P)-dependent dehydrogenase (short-subunit alcohol dehydrogenase family)
MLARRQSCPRGGQYAIRQFRIINAARQGQRADHRSDNGQRLVFRLASARHQAGDLFRDRAHGVREIAPDRAALARNFTSQSRHAWATPGLWTTTSPGTSPRIIGNGVVMAASWRGVAVAGPMLGSDVDRLEAMVNINITAALRLAHAAVAGFVARGQGTLINVSSVLALAPERFNAVYSGTKSFMLNLSLALQAELASTGIRVQAVLPGATRTELWGKAGVDIAAISADNLMDVGDMVDAALVGLDIGEVVTIPSLPDTAAWSRFNDARLAMGPNLSLAQAARRYHRAGEAA